MAAQLKNSITQYLEMIILVFACFIIFVLISLHACIFFTCFVVVKKCIIINKEVIISVHYCLIQNELINLNETN